jgi:hypothetical protein
VLKLPPPCLATVELCSERRHFSLELPHQIALDTRFMLFAAFFAARVVPTASRSERLSASKRAISGTNLLRQTRLKLLDAALQPMPQVNGSRELLAELRLCSAAFAKA